MITTFVFTCMTIMIALLYEKFGGFLGLIVSWFEALDGAGLLNKKVVPEKVEKILAEINVNE